MSVYKLYGHLQMFVQAVYHVWENENLKSC